LLARWPDWWQQIGTNNVLTPHSGEMARLVASDPDLGTVEGEAPWETARRAAARWQQIVVLKGPFTAVADSEQGLTWIYPHANPALATAGTGDVLAGLVAGLVAQGLSTWEAARLAVVAHAHAGRQVAAQHGGRSLIASELPAALPAALAALAGSNRLL
jgi:NAD(P)H-hydrate epimerase